jgi:hypothetical protein
MTMTITPQVMEKIKELVAEGLSRDEIANRLGVTVGLQVTCSRLGIWRPSSTDKSQRLGHT